MYMRDVYIVLAWMLFFLSSSLFSLRFVLTFAMYVVYARVR